MRLQLAHFTGDGFFVPLFDVRVIENLSVFTFKILKLPLVGWQFKLNPLQNKTRNKTGMLVLSAKDKRKFSTVRACTYVWGGRVEEIFSHQVFFYPFTSILTHTFTHARAHSLNHSITHARKHVTTHLLTQPHTHTHTHTHTLTTSHTHARTHARTYSLVYAFTHSLAHALAHPLAHVRTHALTHSRTQTPSFARSIAQPFSRYTAVLWPLTLICFSSARSPIRSRSSGSCCSLCSSFFSHRSTSSRSFLQLNSSSLPSPLCRSSSSARFMRSSSSFRRLFSSYNCCRVLPSSLSRSACSRALRRASSLRH